MDQLSVGNVTVLDFKVIVDATNKLSERTITLRQTYSNEPTLFNSKMKCPLIPWEMVGEHNNCIK